MPLELTDEERADLGLDPSKYGVHDVDALSDGDASTRTRTSSAGTTYAGNGFINWTPGRADVLLVLLAIGAIIMAMAWVCDCL